MRQAKKRLEQLRDELAKLKESSEGMRKQWEAEKEALHGIQKKT